MMIFFAVVAGSAVISVIVLGRILWMHYSRQRRLSAFCADLASGRPIRHRQTP